MQRDPAWVKSRIAARILLRRHSGRLLPRDYRLASRLAQDSGVTDRLIGQALASLCAEKGFSVEQYHAVLHSTLAARA
jgi:hypothetical protein